MEWMVVQGGAGDTQHTQQLSAVVANALMLSVCKVQPGRTEIFSTIP